MRRQVKPVATDSYVTSAQAAKMLNVSLKTVQIWVEKGVLRAWKTPGGHRRIPLAAVESLMREQRCQMVDEEREQKQLEVLVVEDVASLRKLYQRQFETWGLPVALRLAENGFIGLVRIGERRPDLLITDMMMPGMNGVEMVETIRRNPEFDAIDIVVVTALDSGARELQQIERLGIDCLQKPVPFARLRERVEQNIERIGLDR